MNEIEGGVNRLFIVSGLGSAALHNHPRIIKVTLLCVTFPNPDIKHATISPHNLNIIAGIKL
nr:hypothetical protein [Microbulbifer sp. THAF38]